MKNPRPRLLVVLTFLLLVSRISTAHPSPHSLVFLYVSPERVAIELEIPLPELALVLGDSIQHHPETLTDRMKTELENYITHHINAYSVNHHPWKVTIEKMRMDKGMYADSTIPYWELIVALSAIPPEGESTRSFTLAYDAVMHQVMNHIAFVTINSDWETGTVHPASDNGAAVIPIAWNLSDHSIHPLHIHLQQGSWWIGFSSMVLLGMNHIKEGTDHLLFLITLLLPAPLLYYKKRWTGFGGVRYSLTRLLRIITAFTLGHSLTLLIGALGIFVVPEKPVEVLIAFSVLLSAIHAWRPIFPGKEIYVASGFGCVHGLAFATTLSNLHAGAATMTWSILGFNSGIELMQCLIIASVVPWLILLSRTPAYRWVRVTGALGVSVIASGWMMERITGNNNLLTLLVSDLLPYSMWGISALALLSLACFWYFKKKALTTVE